MRDPGERGIPNVVVSNQADVEKTDVSGRSRIARGPTGIVFVSVPDGFRIVGSFWRPADERNVDFVLKSGSGSTDFTCIHASDTHISLASVARTRRFRAMADSVNPAFVIITGDLVRDALRVNEASGYRARSPNSGMPCGPCPATTRTSASSARSRRWRARIPSTAARCTGCFAGRVLALVGMSRYAIALAGDVHVREQLRYAGIPLRFHQTAAVVGPGGSGVLPFPSGITVYHV